MSFQLSDINYRTVADPKGFIQECDAEYNAKISRAADMIMANMKNSRIVLLSGPSGSGKTTTAMKIRDELQSRGVGSHSISMDNYFKTLDPATAPRTPEGDIDLESPQCLDMELLNRHFTLLSRGEKVYVPKFEITNVHPEAFKLYISARSKVEFGGETVFKNTWIRLVRRTVRDHLFRAYPPADTLAMWANVRRGEKHYISPFKDKADLMLDTAFAYELPVMNSMATELFSSIPEGIERYEELRQVLPAIQLFGHIDSALVAPNALIREFIGGGIYEY